MSPESTDQAVLDANEAFYQALEAGDLEVMTALWAHDDDVVCAHPGRPPLRGWVDVQRSWQAIFDGGGNPQVIITDATVGRRGPMAWVTATENLLSGEHTSATTALNVFTMEPEVQDGGPAPGDPDPGDPDPAPATGRWVLVAHHAGPIMAR